MVGPRPGFTLTEVIVAMLLLAVAALGVAATAVIAIHSFNEGELQEHALRDAEQILDSLLLLPANSPGARQLGAARIVWQAADTSGALTVRIDWPHRVPTLLRGQR